MRKRSTLIKISSAWCFLKSATQVYYHLNLNLIRTSFKASYFQEADFCIFISKNCGLKDYFSEEKKNAKYLPIKMHIFRQKFISMLSVLVLKNEFEK